MFSLEQILTAAALLLLLSVVASKASGRLGVPTLILFLAVGMLAGSDGIGGIAFNNARAAQSMGIVALAFILFAGGLETDWTFVRHSVSRALSLATIGVLVTSGIVAWFAVFFLDLTPMQGFLLGAIVSSTDAAAVFSILRASGVRLHERIASTLEVESGTNDPMAVFLTTTAVAAAASGSVRLQPLSVAGAFIVEMGLGTLIGIAVGFGAVWLLNRLRLDFGGLYPVLTIAVVLFAYGATALAHGNGFLAVYVTGLVMGTRNFIQRRSLMRFHDGIAWLMQIAMFLTLGLLVFPRQLLGVTGQGLAIAFCLIFVARPVAVFLSLATSELNVREKLLISWVGLRGAVPIVLATFPLMAGIEGAQTLFTVVFFVVFASVMLQGTTIPLVARWLGVDIPSIADRSQSVARLASRGESALVTVELAEGARATGLRVVELPDWPREALILVLYRGNEFFVPNGATELHAGDRLIVLTGRNSVEQVNAVGAAPEPLAAAP